MSTLSEKGRIAIAKLYGTRAVDLAAPESWVKKHVTIPLESHEFDALTSFASSINEKSFSTSSLVNLLNEGHKDDFPTELRRWVHRRSSSGKRVVSTWLVKIREAEIRMFVSGEYPQSLSSPEKTLIASKTEENENERVDPAQPISPKDNGTVPAFGGYKFAEDAGTPNFSLAEFKCSDGTLPPKSIRGHIQDLMEQLEVLRASLDAPIFINSGYRTVEHNKKIGGVDNSQHLVGKAADIVVRGFTPKQVGDRIISLIAEGKMLQGGVGIYPSRGFVHYDIRGHAARW